MNEKFSNNYELLEKIGEGGLCIIWKIRQRKTANGIASGSLLAFKQLKEIAPDSLKAIKSEYRFLKFHKHPGIVEVFDFVDDPDLTGFTMEYLCGSTLQADCGKLRGKALQETILDILETALFVYHCGYLYNDYKPQNFVYDPKGKLKLIDFNLIQPLNEPSVKKSGTLGYLAPEILTGEKASPYSDIYSIGVTIYELVEGRMPFSALSEDELIKLITESSPEPPGSPHNSLNETIIRMLSVTASSRPANPYEVCRLLGIEKEVDNLVRTNWRFFLDSGCWPFAEKFIEALGGREDSGMPLVAVAGNEYENAGFYKDVVTLARIGFRDVRSMSIAMAEGNTGIDGLLNLLEEGDKRSEESEELHHERNKVESPRALSQKRLFIASQAGKQSGQNGPVYLVNCQDEIIDDIVDIACAFNASAQTAPGIVLFTFAKDASDLKDRVQLYDLTNLPNRTATYLEKRLKRYRINKEFIDKIKDLSDGDPEIISEYLYYLLDKNILRYGPDGWETTRQFDDSVLPESIQKIYNHKLLALSDRSLTILQWLAVLNIAQTSKTLSELTGLKLPQTEEELRLLKKAGWLKEHQGLYFFSSKSMAKAVYCGLSSGCKLSMHRKAAEYIKINNPLDIDGLAFHFHSARNYSQALKYNYKAALKWFNNFNFGKANKFAGTAEEAFSLLGDDEKDLRLVFDTLLLSGDIAKALADNARAEQKYKAAVDMAKKINDLKALAEVYKNLGDLYRLQQEFTASIEYTDKALRLYRKNGDFPHQAACLNNLGLAMWTVGNYDDALENYEKALEINEKIGNLAAQSKINSNIGIIYDLTGRTSEVLRRFDKALKCARAVGDSQSETLVLNNIGFFYLNSGKPQKALECLLKGYKIAVSIGYAEQQLNIMSNIAQAHHKTGNFIKSAKANQKALDIAKTLRHKMYQAQASHLLASDCMAMGNYKLALQMLSQAGEIAASLSNNELVLDILLTGIELELLMGDLTRCKLLIGQLEKKQSLTKMQTMKKKLLEAKLTGLSGGIEAKRVYEKLADEAKKLDLREIAGSALVGLAELCLAENNVDEVERALQRFKDLEIQNTIICLDYNIALATLHYNRKRYDSALELIKAIKKTADDSGCLPFLFKVIILEADILFHCGKDSMFMKTMKQAKNIFSTLASVFPDERDIEGLKVLPSIKRFYLLADRPREIVSFKQEGRP